MYSNSSKRRDTRTIYKKNNLSVLLLENFITFLVFDFFLSIEIFKKQILLSHPLILVKNYVSKKPYLPVFKYAIFIFI